MYLEPWHPDIDDFLDLKKNHGDEEMRARDLFYAIWTPSLFMERVRDDADWSLFCPDQCPGLADCYGDKFKELYENYEASGKAVRTVKARSIWFKILDSQMETGTPYLLYKDANEKSNQKNIGIIKSKFMFREIMEYSDEKETAVCNLASIALSKFVRKDKTFDFKMLHDVTKVVTSNLNKIIDVNFYPSEKTRRSNQAHRPIGIGVQGLADAFALLDLPFYSDTAKEVNKLIFETIYHAALERSNEIAQKLYEENNGENMLCGAYSSLPVPLHRKEFYNLTCGMSNPVITMIGTFSKIKSNTTVFAIHYLLRQCPPLLPLKSWEIMNVLSRLQVIYIAVELLQEITL